MTVMVSEVYDALLEAGASQEKARKAAEAVAVYENRLAGIEQRLMVLTWMVGAVVAIAAPSAWLLLRVAAKVGALG